MQVGTSKSYGGPKDRIPLLPSWAFPDAGNEQPSPTSPEDISSLQPVIPNSLQNSNQQSPVSNMNWRAAKSSLGKAFSGSGGSTNKSFARAGRSYVRALGGARKAASSSATGRSAAAALGGFFADVAKNGINGALQNSGLSLVVGKDAETVFAAITNAFAPSGSSREEAIARKAVSEALEALYERCSLEDGDITTLDRMDADDVRNVFEGVVNAYIYNRWLGELELVIEKKAISAQDAIRLERQVKEYISECVKLDIKNVDVLNMEWNSPSSHKFVEKIFTEAYSLLEGNE